MEKTQKQLDEEKRKTKDLKREWNGKKKRKSVQEEAQRKYNELKKAEAEKLSKEIQMARQDALKKAEDEVEKV